MKDYKFCAIHQIYYHKLLNECPCCLYFKAIDALKSERESLKNDLLDALNLKEGNGPTVLTMMKNEIDKLKKEKNRLIKISKYFYDNPYLVSDNDEGDYILKKRKEMYDEIKTLEK